MAVRGKIAIASGMHCVGFAVEYCGLAMRRTHPAAIAAEDSSHDSTINENM